MEHTVYFRDGYEVTAQDLMNVQQWAQDSSDHIVSDAIDGGYKYVGFGVTQNGTTALNVATGRLYIGGQRFFTDVVTAIDLTPMRPAVQSKVIAIVGWGQLQDEDVEERDYELDATTQTYEPRPVAMESRRSAVLQAIAGAESAAPVAPTLASNVVPIAFVTMSAAGITAVQMNTDAVLENLSSTVDRVAALESFEDDVGPQVSTLKSDLAALNNKTDGLADKKLVTDLAGDMALVKDQLNIPATYVGYRAARFIDTSDEQTGYAGYSARIDNGLRMPYAAQASQALALFNPYDPNAVVSPGSLVLPTYTQIERRITKGQDGVVSLAQYAYENRSLLNITMSRQRIRYGADFEVNTNSAFYLAGTPVQQINGAIRGTFEENGETFQVYDTGKTDADGHQILRMSQYWEDTVSSPYWSRLSTNQVIPGYAHVETFLNAQDAWIVALGPHMTSKPAAGTLTVGICETYLGQPDMDNILAMTTVDAANVGLVSDPGAFPRIAIEPTFLKAGTRYGYFVITAADFYMGVTDSQDANTSGATGTYFYGLNGGIWNPDPSAHLIWRDYRAQFNSTTVNVDLQAMNLAGGIQGVDILADSVVPGSTKLVWSVQIGGVWQPLDGDNLNLLNSLPPLLPMRATFVGTSDIMPGFRLNNSVVNFFRLDVSAKRASEARALATSASSLTVTTRMNGYDPAHHTVTVKVDKAGTIITPSTTQTTTQSNGVVERVDTFNLGAGTTAYTLVTTLATDSALTTMVVAEQIEVAQ